MLRGFVINVNVSKVQTDKGGNQKARTAKAKVKVDIRGCKFVIFSLLPVVQNS